MQGDLVALTNECGTLLALYIPTEGTMLPKGNRTTIKECAVRKD